MVLEDSFDIRTERLDNMIFPLIVNERLDQLQLINQFVQGTY